MIALHLLARTYQQRPSAIIDRDAEWPAAWAYQFDLAVAVVGLRHEHAAAGESTAAAAPAVAAPHAAARRRVNMSKKSTAWHAEDFRTPSDAEIDASLDRAARAGWISG